MHCVHAWCPSRAKEVVRSPGTGVTDAHEPPCECWELNLGPLQELQVLLATELSLQPQQLFLNTILIYFILPLKSSNWSKGLEGLYYSVS